MINWKGDGTKQSLPNQDIKPTFTNRDKEKSPKNPVRIDCVPYKKTNRTTPNYRASVL
jgi:hypothetical protein